MICVNSYKAPAYPLGSNIFSANDGYSLSCHIPDMGPWSDVFN
jgi:hypothetical protein